MSAHPAGGPAQPHTDWSQTLEFWPGDAPVASGHMTAARHRRDTAITTISGIAVFGLGILTGPILARALGADGRGSVAAVIIPTQVLGWLLMFGLPQAAAYYARQYHRRALVMAAWYVAVAVGLPIVLVMWPFVPQFLDQHPPVTVPYFRLFSLTALLVLPFTTVIDQLRGAGRTTDFNIYRALPVVINAVALGALFASGRLTFERALVTALVANLLGWSATIVVHRALPGRGLDVDVLRHLAGYGARVWIGTASTMVVSRFDQLLMVTLVEPRLLGLYVVASTAAQVTGPIGQGVALSLLPHLRAHDRDDGTPGSATAEGRVAQHDRLRNAIGWTLVASGLTALAVASTAWFLLPLVYGREFGDAVQALLILLPGQVCLDLGNVVGAKLEADNRPGAVSTGIALAAGLTIVLTIPAVRLYSIEGAAAVTSLGQAAFLLYVVQAVGPSALWRDPAVAH